MSFSRRLRVLAAAALLSGAAAAASPLQSPPQELRACWLTQYEWFGKSPAQLRELAANVRAGGMNTVYVGVYGAGQTYWPSAAYAAAGGTWASSSFDWTRQVVEVLRDEGLAVGAWFEYGLALGPAAHPIALAHPEWLARDIGGDPVSGENGGFVFLSPGHPEAQALIEAMVVELAGDYDFDDVQLDRVRWARKATGREYGYEAVTAAQYQALHGAPPPSNVNHPTWVAFREGLVNALFERCYAAAKVAHPRVTVSSAPTGSYGIVQHMQRWSAWLAGGYVDVVLLQMYMTSLPAFVNEFATQLAEAGPHADRLGVGYRAQESDDHALVEAQLEHARASGVPHGCLWVYHRYGPEVAIQDEIDHLPLPGHPWELAAENPFHDAEALQLVVDDAAGGGAYVEPGGGWQDDGGPGALAFGARVAPGGAGERRAEFNLALPRGGRYELAVRYVDGPDRNAAAVHEVEHASGVDQLLVDQRAGGGAWQTLGTWFFPLGPLGRRLSVSTLGSGPAERTCADAVRLRLVEALVDTGCVGAPNSIGPGVPLFHDGSTSLAANELVLRASAAPPGQFGVFFYGPQGAALPFGDGTLCVAPGGLLRIGAPLAVGGLGDVELALDLDQAPLGSGPGQVQAGDTSHLQLWYRDPLGPGGSGFNFSSSLVVTWTP